MNKTFILLLFFSVKLMLAEENYEIVVPGEYTNIYNTLISQGFCEIGNRKFLRNDYALVYKKFDDFINFMSNDKNFSMSMHNLEKEFLSIPENKERYCSAPPSYRDPREHTTKRFNKIYFQFIKEHYNLILNRLSDVHEKPSVITFLNYMNKIDSMAKELFAQIIALLDESHPGIKAILYGKYNELTVISKIVRYEKTEGWGTTPHCDKSALSLIWGSDDDNDDSLLICEDIKQPSIEKLKKPQRSFSHKDDLTSAILIPGSACEKVDIKLTPTVHGVAPIQKEYRHAVISFLLIPDIDMSDIMSDFIEPIV